VGRIREHFLALTFWSALWAWGAPAHAEPVRVGLRLAEPGDRSLLARVRGQTGDLDVDVEGVETSALETSFSAQLEAARALARQRGLRVVMWAVRAQTALELAVADFVLDRVLIRPLSGAATALEVSAQEEAAALVARSALRASLAGDALGLPSEQLVQHEEPEALAPPVLPSPVPPAGRPERRSPLGLELGALSGVDGVSIYGHHSLFVRASLRWKRVELGVLGGYGVPVGVDQPLARLRLATHRVEGSVGLPLVRHSWSITPALTVGMRVLRLTADARDASFSAHDARLATLTLGGYARLAYQPGRIGATLRIGLEVLPAAPKLGYEADDGFARTARLWRVQPHLGLALLL
jgi:hypothetical protein